MKTTTARATFGLTVGGAGNTTINSIIGTTTGTLTKDGAGTATLTGANTYTGTTTVSASTLQLNRTTADNFAIPTDGVLATSGDIVIAGGTLQVLQSEQIGNTGSITLTSGAFNFGSAPGKTETIGTFTNNGGTFTTGANTLIGTGNTTTWNSGTNTVNDGGNVQDAHLVISGGTNTVEGGATGGVLQLLTGGSGLEMSAGSTLTLNSSNSVAGKLLLQGNVSVTGNSTVTIASGLVLTNVGSVDLGGGTRTFTVADGAAATDLLVSAGITNGALTKDGGGTLTLSGANLYTGATTINAGILKVDNDGTTTFGKITGSNVTGSIAVNTGGTLLLSGVGDHLADSAAMTLNGGTFNTGGFSETLGVLTLSLSSVIDMGAGNSILHFADSHLASWTGTLSVWNWSGNTLGGGTDQLFFGGAGGGGLTASQLTQVKFYSDAGTTILPFAPGFSNFTGGFGEVVPVPEPSSVVTVMGLLGLIGWRERRKEMQARRAERRA